MFDIVRNNRWLVIVILGLIILTFLFWSVDSYIQSGQRETPLVKVGSSSISLTEYQNSHQREMQRLKESLGQSFSAEALDTPEDRRRLLDRLINRRLLELEADRLKLATNNSELQDFIHRIPIFKDKDVFSMARYQAFLDSQQMQAADFENTLRRDLSVQKLQNGLILGTLVPEVSVTPWLAALSEERSFLQTSIHANEKSVSVTSAQIEAYYKDHPDEFKRPQQVKVSYVVLSPDEFLENAKPDEKEIQAWYQNNISQFQKPEKRAARHILFASKKTDSVDERAKVHLKAEEVRKEAVANPNKFGELAQKYSEDPGSASKGGDLGLNPRGVMVPPFDQAMFSLKKGEISNVIETDFGYHILQVTDIQPSVTQPLDAVRGTVLAGVRREKINEKYRSMAEQFSNLAYEFPDSLQPLADKLSLKVKTSEWIVNNEPPPGDFPASPKLMKAIFSKEVLQDRRNTDAIELRGGALVAARVLEQNPAGVISLVEVKDKIEKKLREQEALAQAAKRGEQALAQLKESGKLPAGLTWSQEMTTSRQSLKMPLPDAVQKSLFSLSEGAYGGGKSPEGYTLVKLNKITHPAPKDADQQKRKYEQTATAALLLDYIEGLKKRYPISIDEALFNNNTTQEF